MIHRKECVEQQAVRLKWLTDWPEHCVGCHGTGGYTVYENHGLPGLGEPLFEPCTCVEENRCPRCGEYTLDEDCRCSKCGWDLEAGGAPLAECFCWEVEP